MVQDEKYNKSKFEISFSSNIYIVKEIVSDSLSFIVLNLPNLTEDDLSDLKLILCELLFNAVIHGNKEDIKKTVSLSIEIRNSTIYTVVSDEGTGFDYMKFLEELDTDKNLLSENGRGIKLVLSLVDNVSFDMDGSAIKFSKKVASHG